MEEITMKSENLAERLRELYQVHGCEDELPAHEGLVSKLDGLRKNERHYFQETLDAGVGRQISYEEALQAAKQRSKFNYGEILGEAVYGTVRTIASGNLRKTAEMFFFEIPARLERETVESLESESVRAERHHQHYNSVAREDFELYVKAELEKAFAKPTQRKKR